MMKEIRIGHPSFGKPLEEMSNSELVNEYNLTYEILTRDCLTKFDTWKLRYILEIEHLLTMRETGGIDPECECNGEFKNGICLDCGE